MGKGGEIFVFDMGQPMRIADLADKMIRLSGKEPGKEIEIVHTGLRPGEKLYEELLATAENTLPTHHPGILIGKVRNDDRDRVLDLVGQLVAETSEPQLPILLRELVPLPRLGGGEPATDEDQAAMQTMLREYRLDTMRSATGSSPRW